MKKPFYSPIIIIMVGAMSNLATAQELYQVPPEVETRWASFENNTAAKGKGGAENKKAKGHSFEFMAPGETKVLMNVTGAGVIQRMWLTISDRSPESLRSLKLEMYWDGAATPAVSVPLGDFFGVGLEGKQHFKMRCSLILREGLSIVISLCHSKKEQK